jgi:hypothetical protein
LINKEEKVWLINKKLKKLRLFFKIMPIRLNKELNSLLRLWIMKEEKVWLIKKGQKIFKEHLMRKFIF